MPTLISFFLCGVLGSSGGAQVTYYMYHKTTPGCASRWFMGPQEGDDCFHTSTEYCAWIVSAVSWTPTCLEISVLRARAGSDKLDNAGSAVACLYVESEAVSPDEIDGPWQEYNSTSGQACDRGRLFAEPA